MKETLAEGQKTALRRRWKEHLAAGFRRNPFENEKLCEWLRSEPAFQQAKRVGLYCPRSWEIDLTPLWEARPEACLFPRVRPGTREMDFYSISSLSELTPGFGKIPEPPADPSRLFEAWAADDLILVPGIFFDRHGYRLGSGMGFYDRYLAGKSLLVWGVCWIEQWLSRETLLPQSHDIPVARVCTPSAAYWTKPSSPPTSL